jgi:hypothetical protein
VRSTVTQAAAASVSAKGSRVNNVRLSQFDL